jgi:hypothetical protein
MSPFYHSVGSLYKYREGQKSERENEREREQANTKLLILFSMQLLSLSLLLQDPSTILVYYENPGHRGRYNNITLP